MRPLCRHVSRLSIRTVVCIAALLSGCGGSGSTGPNSGSIRIATSTTGTNPDSDGYTVAVDGGAAHSVGDNATVTVSAVRAGTHQVTLAGIAGNCLASGQNPQTVAVTAGDTTATAFAVTCEPPPTTAGTIVFSWKHTTDYDVYAMKADGTGVTNLTNTAANADAGPEWSADGSKIAFYTSFDTSGATVIYSMNANGSGLRRVTTDSTIDFEPTWSPDGTKIAFTDFTHHHIVVIDSSGANRTPITSGAFQDQDPAWSPDGAKIAFSTDRDGNYEIYVMNADGSNPIRLTHDAAGGPNDYSPDWSPDGSKIVFQSNRNSALNQIWVMQADGSGLTRLTNGATDDINPTWSPDGSAIVFSRGASGSSTYNLFVMNADGTSQTALTSGTGVGEVYNEPDWKP